MSENTLPAQSSIRMTEDRDKWRKYVHVVANLRSRTAREQNSRRSQDWTVKTARLIN